MIETSIDGRYQILARIAAGGMGEVFRAHDPVLDREVALKILHPSLADDPAFIDRFRREARSAATLSHPNIVNVHDWGQTGGTYFMVMEFIRGANLRALLMRDGALQPAHAVQIVSDVLGALDHAHRQGIVHRDIKPENIMIRAVDGAVKVADFGLARAFADSRVSQAPGTVTGTVQYLAPEQIEGMPAEPRTDLYATGIVLYELLTGQVPFTGETSVAIAWRHLRERVPPPSSANPMVPVDLDRVVLNATERDRERRTKEAATMRADLARTTAELPPARPLAELTSTVTPADEVPADRLATVTIPRTLSPKQRRRQRIGKGFRTISLLALLVVIGVLVWEFVIPHRTQVPELVGDPIETARSEAEASGLALSFEQQYHSTIPAGQVISQTPPPGGEVEEGSSVSVVVSRGPQLETVPTVEGLPEDEAIARIEDAGFIVGRVERVYHETIPKGDVIEQNPNASRKIEVGQSIDIRVSRGPEPVPLPGLAGVPEDQAVSQLEAAGLVVTVVREHSATVTVGAVIATRPPEATVVEQGSTVTLVVSKGPRQFPMPNVIGQPSGEATAQLESLGLAVDVTGVPGSEGDTVVGQLPKAGTTVQQGDTVTIFIGG